MYEITYTEILYESEDWCSTCGYTETFTGDEEGLKDRIRELKHDGYRYIETEYIGGCDEN